MEQTEVHIAHGWDAVPRDGPAVFIANGETLAGTSGPEGAWVRLDRTRQEVAADLGRLIGSAGQTHWLVFDQVGLGPIMVDETPVSDVLGLVRETSRE